MFHLDKSLYKEIALLFSKVSLFVGQQSLFVDSVVKVPKIMD